MGKYGIFALIALLASFALMVSGYAVLIKQALESDDRRRGLKLVWNWRGHEHEMDRRGMWLIFLGAVTGLAGCLCMLIAAYFFLQYDPECLLMPQETLP